MLTLPLEPTDDRADPIFKDEEGCKKWLSQLQLTNLQQVHGLLLIEINELNRYAMRGLERLETLELLRDTVGYVQDEYTRKLVAKPLPLKDHELNILFGAVQLWQAMALGYQRCLQSLMAGDKPMEKHRALLCQRSLLYGGLAIFENQRTGYEFDGKFWRQLHGLYAYAEDQGLLSEKVVDPLTKVQSTCHDTYFQTLLTSYARPAELSRAQPHLLESWLPQWLSMLTVERSYTASKGDAPPLAFDLNDTQHGLQPVRMVKPGEGMRYVAMVPLSKYMRVKTILLQQGKTPEQTELGDLGSSRECIELLAYLHRCWCEDSDLRFAAHNQSDKHAQLCFDPRIIYAQLTGKSYKQPGKSAENSSEARKQIETFGRVLQESPDRKAEGADAPLEIWHIDNENIQGAQFTRVGQGGGQLSRNQLLGVRRGEPEVFMLAVTTWMKVLRTGQLRIGAHYLPGNVEGISLQATGADKNVLDRSVPSFMLHSVPSLKIPSSLIIVHGWFMPGRIVEVLRQNGEKQQVRMDFSVEHGIDYERVSFTQV